MIETLILWFQFFGILVGVGTIVFVSYWHRRFIRVLEQKEVETRLAQIKQLTVIDWQPGMILWMKAPDYSETMCKEIAGELEVLLKEAGVPDPALLVTPDDLSVSAISIVDLLALLGKTQHGED